VTHFVVDASVAVKWYLPEAESTRATALLASGNILSAPGLIYPEVANVFWKRVQRGELEPGQARLFLLDFLSSPLCRRERPDFTGKRLQGKFVLGNS
jgi:predicted nucleic acid-binding protein